MAERSAFDKLHIEESEKADLGGVLEQLNLPPAVVTFVRENKRLVQISIALVVICIVSWALYDSHRETKIENGYSALAMAMESEGAKKIQALESVAQEYEGTDSSLWANITIGHEQIENREFDQAINTYNAIRADVKQTSPLYNLLSAALAQAYEAAGHNNKAVAEYSYLKQQQGYENIGYSGIARIHELNGEKQQALDVYEDYLATLTNVRDRNQKMLIEEKIARIKATL